MRDDGPARAYALIHTHNTPFIRKPPLHSQKLTPGGYIKFCGVNVRTSVYTVFV